LLSLLTIEDWNRTWGVGVPVVALVNKGGGRVLVSFPSIKIARRPTTGRVCSPVLIVVIRRSETPEPSTFLIHFDKRVKGFGIGVPYIKERSYRYPHKSVL